MYIYIRKHVCVCVCVCINFFHATSDDGHHDQK